MSTNKQYNARFVQKIDTEVNWSKASNFYPLKGELIVYAPDETHDHPRVKVGMWDGKEESKTSELLVNNLPFVTDSESFFESGEGGYAIQQKAVEGKENQAFGDNSIALGANIIAGARGYYVSYVYINDTQTGGRVYLSNTQQTPVISSEDRGVIDATFINDYDTSTAVGQYFTLVLDENFDAGATSLAKITAISNNVVEFEGYFLDGNHNKITGNYVPASLEYPVLDDFSFVLPSQADRGSCVVRDRGIAMGKSAVALGIGSIALGNNTYAIGKYTHAQGSNTTAYAYCATSEGQLTKAFGLSAHAEGFGTEAHGNQSHAEGGNSKSYGSSSHAEGSGTNATGHSSHSEGTQTVAEGENAHAEGFKTKALKAHSHAEGGETTADYAYAHAEGYLTSAESQAAHAEGYNTKATGWISHAEGNTTQAKGANGSHAEGQGTIAEGERSHAEGLNTLASGSASHAEGNGSKATNQQAHAEGNGTTASGGCSHAEGTGATASGWASHAEGNGTTASGDNGAHAEGYATQATATAAHSEGQNTLATAHAAHAEGLQTKAEYAYQHVEGKWNAPGNYAHIVGGGSSDSDRKNIHTIDWDGNAKFAGELEATAIQTAGGKFDETGISAQYVSSGKIDCTNDLTVGGTIHLNSETNAITFGSNESYPHLVINRDDISFAPGAAVGEAHYTCYGVECTDSGNYAKYKSNILELTDYTGNVVTRATPGIIRVESNNFDVGSEEQNKTYATIEGGKVALTCDASFATTLDATNIHLSTIGFNTDIRATEITTPKVTAATIQIGNTILEEAKLKKLLDFIDSIAD